jgi:hypothetical protein
MDSGGMKAYIRPDSHNGIDSGGLMTGPAKGVRVKSPSRLRIPLSRQLPFSDRLTTSQNQRKPGKQALLILTHSLTRSQPLSLLSQSPVGTFGFWCIESQTLESGLPSQDVPNGREPLLATRYIVGVAIPLKRLSFASDGTSRTD